jgi:hypothetical protein
VNGDEDGNPWLNTPWQIACAMVSTVILDHVSWKNLHMHVAILNFVVGRSG